MAMLTELVSVALDGDSRAIAERLVSNGVGDNLPNAIRVALGLLARELCAPDAPRPVGPPEVGGGVPYPLRMTKAQRMALDFIVARTGARNPTRAVRLALAWLDGA